MVGVVSEPVAVSDNDTVFSIPTSVNTLSTASATAIDSSSDLKWARIVSVCGVVSEPVAVSDNDLEWTRSENVCGVVSEPSAVSDNVLV